MYATRAQGESTDHTQLAYGHCASAAERQRHPGTPRLVYLPHQTAAEESIPAAGRVRTPRSQPARMKQRWSIIRGNPAGLKRARSLSVHAAAHMWRVHNAAAGRPTRSTPNFAPPPQCRQPHRHAPARSSRWSRTINRLYRRHQSVEPPLATRARQHQLRRMTAARHDIA